MSLKLRHLIPICTIALLILASTCGEEARVSSSKSKTVELKDHNGKFQLYRNGSPYFIEGAGGYSYFDKLKSAGGNSVRIWSSENALEILNEADRLGLTVTIGIKVGYAKSEIDYCNKETVALQKLRIKEEILKYKDHPALLMWGIGNEPTLHLSSNDIVQHNMTWQAINDIAKMVHELDPNHPTTTMLQDISPATIKYISNFCEEIDILSINIFRKVKSKTISDELKNLSWNGPFILSEYGALGYWAEEKRTDWYALCESTSTDKAKFIMEFYRGYVESDKDYCLGSYIFFWGQKDEYTATWLSLFTESGEQTEMVDVVQNLWTNCWPSNMAPSIQSFMINNQSQEDNVYIESGAPFTSTVTTHDTDNDKLLLRWELYEDNTEMYFDATLSQNKPKLIRSGLVKPWKPLKAPFHGADSTSYKKFKFEIKAPLEDGPYRLFIYVQDEHKKVATANNALYIID